MKKLRVLDTFAGIGGFSKGLDDTGGFETVAFCEIEKYPQKVLAKHWPGVPIYDDVRELTYDKLKADGITGIDIVTAGFPCQPHSFSGSRLASKDERDLWDDLFRIVRETGAWGIFENVRGLLSSENGRYFGRILRDLASIGYDVEWMCLPASAFGAEHLRERIYIITYPHKAQLKGRSLSSRIQQKYSNTSHPRRGKDKPGVDRMAYDVPAQMDRLGCLGNAVCPPIPRLIGEAIMELENE